MGGLSRPIVHPEALEGGVPNGFLAVLAAERIASHQHDGLGMFDRGHNLLGSECLVGFAGGEINHALNLALVDIYVSGLHRGYIMGFDPGGGRVYDAQEQRCQV